MFLLRVTPGDNVEHVQLMKWSVAILSFATDPFFVLAVAKSSSATDQLRGCKAQHRNQSCPGRDRRNQSCPGCDAQHRNRRSHRNRLSHLGCDAPFATVAAIATGQLFEG
jgi:hypothetical protein